MSAPRAYGKHCFVALQGIIIIITITISSSTSSSGRGIIEEGVGPDLLSSRRGLIQHNRCDGSWVQGQLMQFQRESFFDQQSYPYHFNEFTRLSELVSEK